MNRFIPFLFLLISAWACTPSDSVNEDLGIKPSSITNTTDGTSGSSTPTAGPDLIKYSGDLQVINVGEVAPVPIGVLAVGLDGAPLANIPVSFSVIGGVPNGNLSAISATTDVFGIAQVTFTAATFIGSVSISAISVYGSQTFTITTAGLTGYALNLDPVVSGDGQIAVINSTLAIPFKVILTNGNGDPVPNTVVRFQSGGGNVGNFSGQSFADVTTDALGVAIAPSFTLSSSQGVHTIRARVLSDVTVFRDITATSTVSSASVINASTSTLTLSSTSAEADGLNVVTFTLIIKDIYGNLIPNNTYGNAITLTPSPSWLGGSLNAATWSYSGTGTYTNSLTVGNGTGIITIGATVNAVVLTSSIDSLTLTPNIAIDLTTTTISALTDPIVADGSSPSTIVITLRNSLGQNVQQSGHTVVITTSAGTLLGSMVYHSATSTYRQVLRAPVSTGGGTLTVTLSTVNGTAVVGKSVNITLLPGAVSLSQSSVSIPSRMVSAVSTAQTVTVYLRDSSNNLVDLAPAPTLQATVTAVAGANRGTLSNAGVLTYVSPGTYNITLTSPASVAGCTVAPYCVDSIDVKLTHASVNSGVAISIGIAKKVQWGMVATLAATPGVLTMPVTKAAAGIGASNLTATLQLVNSSSQLIQVGGRLTDITAVPGFSTPTITIVDNDNGTYNITVPSPASGSTGTLTVRVTGLNTTNGSPTISFYGNPSAAQSTLSLSSNTLSGPGTVDVSLSLRDDNGITIPTLSLANTEVRFSENGNTVLVGANPVGGIISDIAVYSQQVSRTAPPAIGYENINLSAEIFIGGIWTSVSSTVNLSITPPNLAGVTINCTNIGTYHSTDLYVDGGTLTINSSLNGSIDTSGSCSSYGAHPFRFATLKITSTGTVTHTAGTTTIGYGLDIDVDGFVDIAAGGKIDAMGKGYMGILGQGLGYTVGPSNAPGTGSSVGGSYGFLTASNSNPIYGSVSNPLYPGSGGGQPSGTCTATYQSGIGGGLIRIKAGSINNDGVIRVDGLAPPTIVPISCISGGGSGGGMKLELTGSGQLTGTGTISAKGSLGYSRFTPAAPGSGGRIALLGDIASFPFENISVSGGLDTSYHFPGTIYIDDVLPTNVILGGSLNIDNTSNTSVIGLNNTHDLTISPTSTVSLGTPGISVKNLNLQGTLTGGSGNIEVDEDFTMSGSLTTSSGKIVVQGDFTQTAGTITHIEPTLTNYSLYPRVEISAANITITSINAYAKGLFGTFSASACGGANRAGYISAADLTVICIPNTITGANHYTLGGAGGTSVTFGNVDNPFTYGIGGHYFAGVSALVNGGGIVRLITPGQLDVKGPITVAGGNSAGTANSGGSGGSLYINAGTVVSTNNAGSLSARAGTTTGIYGSAGGLIRVYTPAASFSGTITTDVGLSTGTTANGNDGVYTISACAAPNLGLGYCQY